MELKKLFLMVVILSTMITLPGQAQDISQETARHQFDFWLGDWNVYKFGTDTIIGISSIRARLDHRVLEENYQALKYRYRGKSMNVYDEKAGRWEQFYMDNKGLKLYTKGSYGDHKMTLSDCYGTTENCNRVIWTDMRDDTVRQEWEQSEDFGKTWRKVFDGHYKKRL